MDTESLLVSENLLVFDIEANDLLNEATEVYCIVARNIKSGEIYHLDKDSLYPDNIGHLFDYSTIIGHNIIDYDIPMISKFYGIDLVEMLGNDNIIDTCLWSRVLYPDRPLPKGCPTSVKIEGQNKSRLIGQHSLEA